jgi:hypothetical protein
MVDPINFSALMSLGAIITALGTAWLTVRKIAKDSEKQKQIQAAKILQAAKEADSLLRTQLESKIHDLQTELKVLKESNEKDLNHLKETYNGEIKFLGQKIEELRSEVRNQHGQLVQLLSKMIEKQD